MNVEENSASSNCSNFSKIPNELEQKVSVVIASNKKISCRNRTGIEISSLCICQANGVRKSSIRSWLFSITTVLLCVFFPMLSFVADVSFFVVCSDHYEETKAMLDSVQNKTSKLISFVMKRENASFDFEKKIRAGVGQSLSPLLSNSNSGFNITHNISKKEKIDFLLRGSISGSFKQNENKIYPDTFDPDLIHVNHANNGFFKSAISTHCHSNSKVPVCGPVANILSYMSTTAAVKTLKEHKRVTADVFEPVFVIGSFPCLVLSVFTRLVVMVTNHDHFLSAFVVNIISMPLQLVTGALSVHSASFHVGQYGFQCWKCAIDGNCSNISALSFVKDHVTLALIIATVAKFMDGIAGGCILFVVLARLIWTKENSKTRSWCFCRVVFSFFSFLFCIVLSSTMVLTPILGVFRLEMMENTAHFSGKNGVCYGSMAFLAMGLTAWGLTIVILFVYSCLKTFIYCRSRKYEIGLNTIQ